MLFLKGENRLAYSLDMLTVERCLRIEKKTILAIRERLEEVAVRS